MSAVPDPVRTRTRRPGAHQLRVLDLFSGLNGWGDPFREAGHQVFAIDIAPDELAAAGLDKFATG